MNLQKIVIKGNLYVISKAIFSLFLANFRNVATRKQSNGNCKRAFWGGGGSEKSG
jgi:hypothetical protein